MSEITTDLKARAEYIAETHDVPLRAGFALQLAEIGYSNSGISNKLGVTESTIGSYQEQLEESAGEKVWYAVTSNKPRYDTFPTTSDDPEYSGDHIDIEPRFKERERPLNQGKPISELDLFQ